MSDYNETPARGSANGNEPALTDGMVGIVESCGQWVIVNSNRLVERDPVFPEIALRLRVIPFKLHQLILSWYVARGTWLAVRAPSQAAIIGR